MLRLRARERIGGKSCSGPQTLDELYEQRLEECRRAWAKGRNAGAADEALRLCRESSRLPDRLYYETAIREGWFSDATRRRYARAIDSIGKWYAEKLVQLQRLADAHFERTGPGTFARPSALGTECRDLAAAATRGVGEVTEDPRSILSGATLDDLHRFCAATAASFREGHEMTVGSQEHSQKLMVWLGGLMGAGVFSVYGLLAAAPRPMRLSVLVPWTAGILFASLAGLLNGEVAERNNKQHFSRIALLELLQLHTDKELILKNLRPIIEAGVLEKDPETVSLRRWLVATNSTFYLTHVFFVIGAVAAVTTMIVLGR